MYRSAVASILFVVCLAMAGMSPAGELGGLVRDLAGPNEEARAAARQLLPRHGADAVEPLLPLLEHENMPVSRAAFNVLADIANAVAAPGREAERSQVARLLMTLIAPERSAPTKRMGLRLLAPVVAEGGDVAPITALLREPELREEARSTLYLIGTREAARALADALPAAEPAFACGLLDAIEKLQDPATVPATRTCIAHGDPAVRAAAARALAWTGDVSLVPVLREVCAQAGPDTQFAATDALLHLADAIAQRGGNWEWSMRVYKDVLAASMDPKLRTMAMMGLGRYGDETAVPAIVEAASSGGAELEAAAVMAFESLNGAGAAKAMVAAYPAFSQDARLGLIGLFGRRHDTRFVPPLIQELESGDPVLQLAALDALAGSQVLDALPPLAQLAESGPENLRQRALEGAFQLAGSVATGGKSDAAGKAFLRLYSLASEDPVRLRALEGIAAHPVAEAYDVVNAALDVEALRGAALSALAGLVGPLARAGSDDKALAAFQTVAKADPAPERLLAMAGQLQGVRTGLDTTRLLGVVKHWHLIGPFEWAEEADWEEAFVGEPDIDLGATYAHGDAYLDWTPHQSQDAVGAVNLMATVAQRDRCFAYAYTTIIVEQPVDAQLRIGSDDGVMAWVNGTRVWDNRVDRGMAMDQDIADVHLAEGANAILLKISQGAGGWGFCMRITTADGLAVPFSHPE
ncbi:MAG: HEAT repeat domain-containing protein, partial [Candidatus Hydrogenedentes bacterium]|nr:HEAT repeat domain-containing protein [Candidatus Hydrogenedentota bacterium]